MTQAILPRLPSHVDDPETVPPGFMPWDASEFLPSTPIPSFESPSKPSYPVPRGDSAYARAKKAEYIERDLENAEHYYKFAIMRGERVDSAVKDLAGVLHQQGKTKEACDFLEQYRYLFLNDLNKYDNLLLNLQKQVIPTGNCLNKSLKISKLSPGCTAEYITSLFKNPSRIQEIERAEDYAILKFASHSAARKTLEGFHMWDVCIVEWINVHGEVVGNANYAKVKAEEMQRTQWSFFGGSADEEKPYQLYSHFPKTPLKHEEDPVDELLNISLMSYFNDANVALK